MAVHTMSAVRPDPAIEEDRGVRANPERVASAPFDNSERLRPARGIGYGLLISVPFWVVVATLLWFYL